MMHPRSPRSIRQLLFIVFNIALLCTGTPAAAASDDSPTNHIGFNYALALQKKPLDTNVAAEILSTTFPSLKKAKLFGSSARDQENARALLKAGIKDITVAITQYDVYNAAASTSNVDEAFAKNFVDTVVVPLMDEGATVSVVVGNEPLAYWHATPGDVLVAAYRNVRSALIDAGVKEKVKMMVPFQTGVLQDSYPPQNAIFREDFRPAIEEISTLMYEDGDPFEVNIYPYFAFRDNPEDIPLDFALGNAGNDEYGSLFQAMYAAVEAALLKLNSNFTEDNLVVVGEVGWPTEDTYFPAEHNGWRNDTGFPHANVENAKTFMNNVLATGLPVYVFEAFDEQAKATDSGAGTQFSNVENHWGIFTEDGELKYDVPLLMAEPADNDAPPTVVAGQPTSDAVGFKMYSLGALFSGVLGSFAAIVFPW